MLRGRVVAASVLVLLPLGAVGPSACGGRQAGAANASIAADSGAESSQPETPDSSDDESEASTDGADATADAGNNCDLDALAFGYFGDWASPVAGTMRGPYVDGFVCQGATAAYVQQIVPQGTQQSDYTLFFLETPFAYGYHPMVLQFTSPSDVRDAWISIQIGLVPLYGAPIPGTYTDADSSCGNLNLTLESPRGDFTYYAAGARDCSLQEIQTPLGSWTLQITSVDGREADGGPGSYYVVHGSLEAQLVEEVSTNAGTVTFSFTF